MFSVVEVAEPLVERLTARCDVDDGWISQSNLALAILIWRGRCVHSRRGQHARQFDFADWNVVDQLVEFVLRVWVTLRILQMRIVSLVVFFLILLKLLQLRLVHLRLLIRRLRFDHALLQ